MKRTMLVCHCPLTNLQVNVSIESGLLEPSQIKQSIQTGVLKTSRNYTLIVHEYKDRHSLGFQQA